VHPLVPTESLTKFLPNRSNHNPFQIIRLKAVNRPRRGPDTLRDGRVS
jgi:hypothetical protein